MDPIPVTVYYESLCPDSIKFITTQLFPVWNSSLNSHIKLKLIPFGKASYTQSGDNWNFTCHHGEKECEGNKVQACALMEPVPMDQQVRFINCVMATTKENPKEAEYPTKKCGEKTKIDYEKINMCATTGDGSRFLVEMGKETMAFQNPLTNIPLVSFNGKYDKADQEMAVNDFRKAVCSKITGEKPADCSANSASATAASVLVFLGSLLLSRNI